MALLMMKLFLRKPWVVADAVFDAYNVEVAWSVVVDCVFVFVGRWHFSTEFE